MSTERLTKLESLLPQLANAKDRINCLLDICSELRLYDIDEAMKMALQANIEAQEVNYSYGIGRSKYAIGTCHWQKGESEQGLKILKEAVSIASHINNKKLEAKANNILGNICRDLGELSSALKYYLRALRTFEKLGEEQILSVVMKNISVLHFDLFDYDNALDYALKSEAILEKYDNKFRQFNIYITLGNIYFKKEDKENALHYFYKALNLSETETSTYALAKCGLGKVYFMQNNFVKAKENLHEAMALSEKYYYIESTIVANFYLGRTSFEEKKYQEAILFYNKAIGIAKEQSRKHDIMSVHEHLAIVYEQINNIPEAYLHLKAFSMLKEEIFQSNTFNKLKNLQVKYELDIAYKEKEVAENTAQLKQQFMANMSHEIRTPMNAIIGITDLLIKKPHNQEQQKFLHAIQLSAKNLLVIINDVLDLSKIEAGKIVIETIPFSLKNNIETVHEMLQIKADEKSIAFAIHVDDTIPNTLIGDPTRINQVLINLTSNAIKFTDKGSVTINCSLLNKTDKKVNLQFAVQDTGIGISQDYVKTIFDSFTQAGSDTARKYGGTGLGLTISKQLTDLMNGTLTVKSEKNEGSTFYLTLTLPIADEQILENNASFQLNAEQINVLENATILLAEDNEFNRLLAIETLKEIAPNIQIDTAENGKIACEKASLKLYNIILMDIQMPEMNGLDATKFIRNNLEAPRKNVPIIAMTANVMQADIQQYFAIGMNEFIPKPFTTELFLQKILSLLQPNNSSPKIVDKSIEKNVEIIDASNEKITDLTFLQAFTRNDMNKQKKYVQLFLDNAPNMLANAETALQLNDMEGLKIAVHSLKSQLNYMGVKEEISNAQALETASKNPTLANQLQPMLQKLTHACNQTFVELNHFVNQ